MSLWHFVALFLVFYIAVGAWAVWRAPVRNDWDEDHWTFHPSDREL